MDEYYYSGSSFYDEADGDVRSAFSDVSEAVSSHPDRVSLRARRYGQWWRVTGINPDCPDKEHAAQQLRHDYTIMAPLHQPALPRLVAMIETPLLDGEAVIEEWIDGTTLVYFLKTNPDDNVRAELLDQLLDALEYCHGKGIAHGHLSTDNLLVAAQGHSLKLTGMTCGDETKADVKALADIIEALQPNVLSSVARQCRQERLTTVEQVQRAIATRRSSSRWRMPLIIAAMITIIAAAAFWGGHRQAIQNDKVMTDSLPLPAIYFSDTISLNTGGDNGLQTYWSTVTHAMLFYYNWQGDLSQDISEDVAVDLGLSVLWAPFNVGCTDGDVNHLGGYCTWCDTLGVGIFRPAEEQWPASRPLVDIAGTDHDPVRRLWDSNWRMPTARELQELHDCCVWTLVRQRGLPLGYLLKGPNGNSIFLPMAGYREKNSECEIGLIGSYWSSSPVTGINRCVYAMRLDTTIVTATDTVPLGFARSIRPVLDRLPRSQQ
ncbi:MAG: hypothetical protein J6S96_03520 [Muribaculaceae bacterium]|nr:hypothetical protein [Muribaculaceae bacterium]